MVRKANSAERSGNKSQGKTYTDAASAPHGQRESFILTPFYWMNAGTPLAAVLPQPTVERLADG